MGLSQKVSQIDGDFSRKSENFPTPYIFRPRWRGSPWNWVSGLGIKKRIIGLQGRERSSTISSAVWIQYTNVTDGRTERQTDTGRQQRPRLRIASRGKKNHLVLFKVIVYQANRLANSATGTVTTQYTLCSTTGQYLVGPLHKSWISQHLAI